MQLSRLKVGSGRAEWYSGCIRGAQLQLSGPNVESGWPGCNSGCILLARMQLSGLNVGSARQVEPSVVRAAMDPDDFRNPDRGRLVPTEGVSAFVPEALPRSMPLEPEIVSLIEEASLAAARLDGVGETIPNPNLLIAPFLRREAVLSSRIEGTQASVSDVYVAEATGKPRGDAQEVVNHVRALQRGLELLDRLPICVRLARELHEVLLTGVRGQDEHPGELRTIQVWIGAPRSRIEDARFVPPPPHLLTDLLSEWEAFIHDESPLPTLVRCALMHYQFEAIHPFRDGNGRVGRLLISLLLSERRVLTAPLLYLSAYFEQNRQRYYDELYALSTTGDWTPWLRFFLTGVQEQAEDALARARRVRDLHDDYRQRLHGVGASANALQLAEELFVSPVITARRAAEVLGVSNPGARRIIRRLTQAGIVRPIPDSYPQLHEAHELIALVE